MTETQHIPVRFDCQIVRASNEISDFMLWEQHGK